MSTSAQDRSRTPLRTPSLLAVLVSVAFGLSTFAAHYPLTVEGRNASLRDRFLLLLAILFSVCWVRARNHRRAYLIAFAVVAVVLGLESLVFSYGPTGGLGWAWWDEKVTAVAMLLCCAAGWSRAPGVERWLRQNG